MIGRHFRLKKETKISQLQVIVQKIDQIIIIRRRKHQNVQSLELISKNICVIFVYNMYLKINSNLISSDILLYFNTHFASYF